MLTKEQKEKTRKMREEDNSYGTIAKKLNCDYMAVKRWCRKNGLGGIRNSGKRNVNLFIEKDNYIVGADTKGREFIFDKEDIEKVKEYYWFISSEGYVITSRDRKTIGLHRHLMEPREDEEVDHINHKPSDCRRINMRICSHKQNSTNRRTHSNNVSGYKGVGYHSGKYRARIKVNGTLIDLGRYDTAEEAHKAYSVASIKHHKEYGCTM